MNSKIIFFSVLTLFFVLISCNSDAPSNEQKSEPTTEVSEHNTPQKTTVTVENWPGTYWGTLPCASCPGVKTTIILREGNTYERTVEYLESTDAPATTKGEFQWNEDKSIITIEDNSYAVANNQLQMLGEDNKVVEGELAAQYILKKTTIK